MKTTKTIIVLAITLFTSIVTTSKVSAQTAKKVLIVLTSHEDLGNTGKKTGFWLEEFADPYYLLMDNGIAITLASPKGGRPPMDPSSAAENYQTKSTKRFTNDKIAQEQLSNTVKLETINVGDYDAIYYPGGHGPLWDLAEDKTSIALIEDFYNANKTIAFVCHAPAVLKNTTKKDGTPLIKVVPFLVEDMLTKNGGIYSKGADWSAYAIEDGNLITGQNPASAKLVAEKLLSQLK
jgi:putative intracellular protease/amidase